MKFVIIEHSKNDLNNLYPDTNVVNFVAIQKKKNTTKVVLIIIH